MEVADHFDLCGKILLAQKRALIGQRNPEFPMLLRISRRIGSTVTLTPFAVRRLLPWVHLRHGASYRFEARRTVTLLLTASVRFHTFAGGFPHSPQRPMGKTGCVAPRRSSADDSLLAPPTNIEARSLECANFPNGGCCYPAALPRNSVAADGCDARHRLPQLWRRLCLFRRAILPRPPSLLLSVASL